MTEGKGRRRGRDRGGRPRAGLRSRAPAPVARASLALLAAVVAAGCAERGASRAAEAATEDEPVARHAAGPREAPVAAGHPVTWDGPPRELDAALRLAGLGREEAAHLTGLARHRAGSASSAVPSGALRVESGPDGGPRTVVVEMDADRRLRFARHGARWAAWVDSLPARTDTLGLRGRVEGHLLAARLETPRRPGGGESVELEARERAEVIHALAEVLASRMDAYRDPRPGDRFRILWEREVRSDGSARATRLLAVQYAGRDGLHAAFRFRGEGAAAAYYAPDGRPARGTFLRAPLELVRVTSRFSEARLHPVLARTRPHHGVDYGAPAGTTVRATAAGRVSRAGWWGSYGRIVEVDHGGGLRTRYAHLASIPPHVRPGARVEQGESLGRVGATGLTTGPHLHYEMLRHGRPVDPAREARAAGVAVGRAGPGFLAERNRMRALLRATGWPVPEGVARPGP